MEQWIGHLLLHSFGLALVGAATLVVRLVWRSDPIACYRLMVLLLLASLALPAAQYLVKGRAGAWGDALRSRVQATLPSDPDLAEPDTRAEPLRRVDAPSERSRLAPAQLSSTPPSLAEVAGRGRSGRRASRSPGPALSPLPRPARDRQTPPELVRVADSLSHDAEPQSAGVGTTLAAWAQTISATVRKVWQRLQGSLALFLAYGLGLLVVGTFHGLRHRRTRRLLASSKSVTDARILRIWRKVSRRSPIGARVELLQHDSVRAPACWGLLRPRLVLPADPARLGSDDVLKWAMRHELVHLERGDARVAALQSVLTTLFWFHPVAWWISRELDRQRELSCDLLVVLATGARKSYALALLDYAHTPLSPRPEGSDASARDLAQPVCPTLLHWSRSPSQLRRRIEMLARKNTPPTRRRRWLRRAAVGGMLASLWGGQLAIAATFFPGDEEEEARPNFSALEEGHALRTGLILAGSAVEPKQEPSPRATAGLALAQGLLRDNQQWMQSLQHQVQGVSTGTDALLLSLLSSPQQDNRKLERQAAALEKRLRKLDAELRAKEREMEKLSRELERRAASSQNQESRGSNRSRSRSRSRSSSGRNDLRRELGEAERLLEQTESRLAEREARAETLERALGGTRDRHDRRSTDRHREHAERGRRMAEEHRQRAEEHRHRAEELGREHAERGRRMAEEHRRRAEELGREHAERGRHLAEEHRHRAEEMRRTLEAARGDVHERDRDSDHRSHERRSDLRRRLEDQAERIRERVERSLERSNKGRRGRKDSKDVDPDEVLAIAEQAMAAVRGALASVEHEMPHTAEIEAILAEALSGVREVEVTVGPEVAAALAELMPQVEGQVAEFMAQAEAALAQALGQADLSVKAQSEVLAGVEEALRAALAGIDEESIGQVHDLDDLFENLESLVAEWQDKFDHDFDFDFEHDFDFDNDFDFDAADWERLGEELEEALEGIDEEELEEQIRRAIEKAVGKDDLKSYIVQARPTPNPNPAPSIHFTWNNLQFAVPCAPTKLESIESRLVGLQSQLERLASDRLHIRPTIPQPESRISELRIPVSELAITTAAIPSVKLAMPDMEKSDLATEVQVVSVSPAANQP